VFLLVLSSTALALALLENLFMLFQIVLWATNVDDR
jgi:hypothetical protein